MTATEWSQFIDPGALALVGLGCLAIALIQNGASGVTTGFISVPRLFRRAGESERARLAALMIEDLVRRRGIGCADRGPQSCPFAHDIGELMSNEHGYDSLSKAVGRMLAARSAKRVRAVQVWNDIADAAPALGMLGTVLGLVRMFGSMESAAGIGAAMALCLLTSLYGLVFAHLVAGPIARRLAMIGDEDALWQEDIASRLLVLARREYPDRAPNKPLVEILGAMPDVCRASA